MSDFLDMVANMLFGSRPKIDMRDNGYSDWWFSGTMNHPTKDALERDYREWTRRNAGQSGARPMVTLDSVRDAAAEAARAKRVFYALAAMNTPPRGPEYDKAMMDYNAAKAEMMRTSRALEMAQEGYAWGQ